MLKMIRNFVLFLSAVLLLAACQQQGGPQAASNGRSTTCGTSHGIGAVGAFDDPHTDFRNGDAAEVLAYFRYFFDKDPLSFVRSSDGELVLAAEDPHALG